MKRTRRHVCFTLVELLVVVAIIAVLASLLLPALTKARQQARLTQCLSNMRNQGLAYAMYVDEFNGEMPHRVLGRIHQNYLAQGQSALGDQIDILHAYSGKTFAENGDLAIWRCPEWDSFSPGRMIEHGRYRGGGYTSYVPAPYLSSGVLTWHIGDPYDAWNQTSVLYKCSLPRKDWWERTSNKLDRSQFRSMIIGEFFDLIPYANPRHGDAASMKGNAIFTDFSGERVSRIRNFYNSKFLIIATKQ